MILNIWFYLKARTRPAIRQADPQSQDDLSGYQDDSILSDVSMAQNDSKSQDESMFEDAEGTSQDDTMDEDESGDFRISDYFYW